LPFTSVTDSATTSRRRSKSRRYSVTFTILRAQRVIWRRSHTGGPDTGVLGRDIVILSERPHVGWTTSRLLDLLPDGTTVGFDNDPPEGELPPGVVFEHWRTHNYRAPVHPTTICIRRQLAVALGGWMGVPGSDDTGLLMAASVTSTGYFHGEVGLLYRKWPGQVTASTQHGEPIEWKLRMGLVEDRASALMALLPAGLSA
jgi:hypothetical protein